MNQQKSYEEQFIERIDREFEEFKKKLENECKTQGDIMKRSYEIWVKSMFASTLSVLADIPESTYKKWCEVDGNILQGLFENYRDDRCVFKNEEGDKSRIIENYFHWEAEEDYKQSAIKKIEEQFKEFKVQLLAESQTKEDMFYKAFEINAKTALLNAIKAEEMSEEVYYAIAKTDENTLQEMYMDFIGEKSASLNSDKETAQYIEQYCQKNYEDLIEEYEQSHFEIQQS